MSRSLALLLLLLVVGTSAIFNGTTVSLEEVGARYPWMASIVVRGVPYCGGFLLNENVMVTAAHCSKEKSLDQKIEHWEKSVVVHRSDLSSREEDEIYFDVIGIQTHPSYMFSSKSGYVKNDIAVWHIRRNKTMSADFLEISQFPELITDVSSPIVGYRLQMIGWGQSELWSSHKRPILAAATRFADHIFGDFGPERNMLLRSAEFVTTSKDSCRERYGLLHYVFQKSIKDSHICVRPVEDHIAYACPGDSGSPLFEIYGKKAFVYGVASYSRGCGTVSDKPVVFTRISSYVGWINDIKKTIAISERMHKRHIYSERRAQQRSYRKRVGRVVASSQEASSIMLPEEVDDSFPPDLGGISIEQWKARRAARFRPNKGSFSSTTTGETEDSEFPPSLTEEDHEAFLRSNSNQ
ncbi:MAG: hypothetical protein SGCHY_003382 [Lobulomycetales sp.]